MANNPLLLNLGCGVRTHPDWVNIDFSLRSRLRSVPLLRDLFGGPNPPGYVNYDLRHGIPYPDASATVVYSSHVLEHLDPGDARGFVVEMRRALRPGGIVRIVVPDLEVAARRYLTALDAWRSADHSRDAELRYDWSVIWLIDQMVRTRPGGIMTEWLRQHRETDVVRNLGGIVEDLATELPASQGALHRALRYFAARRDPRRSGEVHRWMYDDASLGRLLSAAGFRDLRRVRPEESRIPDWTAYALDVDRDGRPHQPDSIWMEGLR